MASLLDKLRTLVLGNAHDLVDRVIDMNSMAAVRQNIRDLEEARNKMNAQVAVATGRVNTLKADLSRKENNVREMQEAIDLLLGDNDETNDADALKIQVELNSLLQQAAGLKEEMATTEKFHESMVEAHKRVVDRHGELLNRMQVLQQHERSAEANRQAADALEQAGALSNVDGALSSVDSVERQIQERSATQKARLEQALGSISSSSSESVALVKAREALAARKRALQGAGASAAAQ